MALAAKRRLPVISQGSDDAEAGALLSYGRDQIAQYRRVAVFVDKILKGARPGDLPVERPTKFELVINLKTAKQMGVTNSTERAGAGGQSHQMTVLSNEY
jgi:ABC-type uncharacterized transport system substrate-binding protein